MSEATMPPVNGTQSPPPQSDTPTSPSNLSAKRKRVEGTEVVVQMNGVQEESQPAITETLSEDSQQQIEDFIEVLKSHDTKPSILNKKLPLRDGSAEPNPKRKKASSDADSPTINTRASSASYLSLEEVVSDIKTACGAMLHDLDLPSGPTRNQYTPIPTEKLELGAKIAIFKKTAEDLQQREAAYKKLKAPVHSTKEEEDSKSFMNGNTTSKSFTQLTTAPGDNKLVLTLYGNAPGPKQLFSSLQEPVKNADGRTDVTYPLREVGLPNGISTTQIVPIQSTGLVEDKKRVPTLGDMFSASSGFSLQPPKPSKVATTRRESNLGWYQPTAVETARLRNTQSYFGQSITTGHWLEYSGVPTSPDAKKKLRERALSLSGARVTPSATEVAQQEAAKLDALFQSAYSAFAPSKDDAAAIVPEGLVNRVWWQKLGEKSFERLMNNAVNMDSITKEDPDAMEISTPDDVEEIEQFKEAVDNWEMIDPSLEEASDSKTIEEKEVEEILQDISELLETLNSYQRNRNLAINAVPRPVGVLSAFDTTPAPTKPTEAEIATYNILKSQLSLMVATLPPYAVAKLNSDQLSELNISTKIEVLTDNYKGVMEEDEVAARAKMAAMTGTASSRPTPSTLHRSSSSSLYGNQYASTARPAATNGQYFAAGQQTPVRQSSTSSQRPPQTAPVPYGGARPAVSNPYRTQTNYSTPTYPHQVARPPQQQFNSATQQYFQTPAGPNYAGGLNQTYRNVPQTAPQVNYGDQYRAPNQNFQQRPQLSQNGLDYRYGSGNTTSGQGSPQKPAYSPQPQMSGRPGGPPTPTPPMPQERRYFQSSASNGTTSMSPQPQVAQQPQPTPTVGVTGYHTVMTAAEQSNMMERQRAQLAQQQGTQAQARNAAQAGASTGTSPQVNGGSAVTAGL